MTVEIIDEVKEPFIRATIEVYDDVETGTHIPVMEFDFLEGYPIDITHMISFRDSIALFLHKIDQTLYRQENLVIVDDEE